MKISQLFPKLTADGDPVAESMVASSRPAPGSVLVIDHANRSVSATDWIKGLEAEVLARAATVTKVDNAQDNALACEAQASLARYQRAVQAAEDKAKKPLNEIRGKILAMSKELQAQVETEGNRLGKLVADFQYAESMRVAAARRLQDEREASLARERDEKLLKCRTPEQIEAVNEEMADQLAAEAPPVKPIRAQGQVVKEDWDVQVVDIWLLGRAKPSCVKIEPRLSEIKALLNAGVKVEGCIYKKITKAGIRLSREEPAIAI